MGSERRNTSVVRVKSAGFVCCLLSQNVGHWNKLQTQGAFFPPPMTYVGAVFQVLLESSPETFWFTLGGGLRDNVCASAPRASRDGASDRVSSDVPAAAAEFLSTRNRQNGQQDDRPGAGAAAGGGRGHVPGCLLRHRHAEARLGGDEGRRGGRRWAVFCSGQVSGEVKGHTLSNTTP